MIHYDTIFLEKLKFGIMQRISHEFACRPEVSVSEHVNFMSDEIALMVRFYILGKQHETVEYSHPMGWWDAVKERFAPAWFTKRWPVRHTRHVLNVKQLFPKLAVPDGVYHVEFAKIEPSSLFRD
jgi:hypothetical protein